MRDRDTETDRNGQREREGWRETKSETERRERRRKGEAEKDRAGNYRNGERNICRKRDVEKKTEYKLRFNSLF